MKFSILMPAYNDEKYISESINSVISQNYDDWELIIINDGSSDNTESVIKSFNDKRIRYIYQKNSDQLNALINGSREITGDIVVLLHSDDLLSDNSVLSDMNLFFLKYEKCEGLYSDYIKIDESSNITGRIKTVSINKNIIKSIFFTRGSNPVGDHFAVRNEVFYKYIYNQYLNDNTIYFVDYEKADIVSLKKFRPWYKYRITSDNYASNDIGKFVENNGRLRTLYKLLASNYRIRPEISNLFIKRLINKFSLYSLIRLIKKSDTDWDFIIRYYSSWKKDLSELKYPELSILVMDKIIKSAEARKYKNESKPLKLNYNNEKIYSGKDARIFYKDYYEGTLNNLFNEILTADFDHIVVSDDKTMNAVRKILVFYCLFFNIRKSA